MLSRFEIEGAPLGENSVESEEDEEEVWLFWKDNNKEIRSKSIRELAQDAKEGQKEDQEVVSYYRYYMVAPLADLKPSEKASENFFAAAGTS